MSTAQVPLRKPIPKKSSGKRKEPDSSLNYGGWTEAEHMTFIEGYKINDCNWKEIQSSLPHKTISEIKDHAVSFFNKIEKICPHKTKILDFVRNKPSEFFKHVTFAASSSKYTDESKEEEKIPAKHKLVEPINHPPPMPKPEYVPTQSHVINDTLKKITSEMISLLQSLTGDIKRREDEIEKDLNIGGYWGYIYNSAIYLQQIINDITVAHNSTLACVYQFSRKGGEQGYNSNK